MHRQPSEADESGFDMRFDAAFQPGYDDDVDLFVFDAPDEIEAPVGDRRPVALVDRFVVAIWITGTVLIVAAIVAIVVISDQRALANLDQNGYVMYAVFSSLSPFVLVVGLATLIGSLVLLAHRWERRS